MQTWPEWIDCLLSPNSYVVEAGADVWWSVLEVRKSTTEQGGLSGEPCGSLWGAPACSGDQAPCAVGCWAARAFRKQAGLSSEVGSTGLRVSAQLSSSRSLGRQGRCRAAAAVPLSWEGRTLSPAAGAGTAGLSPTSRRTAPSPTGLGRHWILPSSARKQWLSLQWWKERNGAPSTTPLRWVSCLPLWTLILSHKTK